MAVINSNALNNLNYIKDGEPFNTFYTSSVNLNNLNYIKDGEPFNVNPTNSMGSGGGTLTDLFLWNGFGLSEIESIDGINSDKIYSIENS